MEGSALVAFIGGLAVLLLAGRAAGDVARRLGQPEVLGALAAGVVLGPSALGGLWPGLERAVLHGDATGPALDGVSNLGAVLLLLAAGLEVDVALLKRERRPGLWVAATAIVPSVLAGALLGGSLGMADRRAAIYLGVVLSVTAVSVVSALLIESGQTRRRYAQVILAGGVAAEVSCWVLVSAASARPTAAVSSGLRSLAFAAAVFAVAYLVGRRLVPAVMRFANDRSRLGYAPVTAVVVLALGAGAGTAALGLHPLLGAFIVGVLLRRSPRRSPALLERLESLTGGVLGPVFFVLAGTRVDVGKILSPGAVLQVIGLLAVATLVKVVPVAVGARLGGLRSVEVWVVATGMCFKGGTDVLVAILGQQLGVLSVQAYTEYAVVSLVTVAIAPTALRALERRVAVPPDEHARLAEEEADRRSYLPGIERVLVPFLPGLHATLAADVVDRLARTTESRARLIDVTELHAGDEAGATLDTLAHTEELQGVEVRRRRVESADPIAEVLAAAGDHELLALGFTLDDDASHVLSPDANRLIDGAAPDVLVAAGRGPTLDWASITRILVPVNGTPHARAAAEVAGRLAESCGAEVVLLCVVDPRIQEALSRRSAAVLEHSPATAHLAALRFLLRGVDARVTEELRSGDPAAVLAAELADGAHDLVVMGAVDQPGDGVALMGPTVEVVLTQRRTPYVVLVTHDHGAAPDAADAVPGAPLG